MLAHKYKGFASKHCDTHFVTICHICQMPMQFAVSIYSMWKAAAPPAILMMCSGGMQKMSISLSEVWLSMFRKQIHDFPGI